MDILHISSELAPYAAASGLADVASALTKHLRLLGHKVTLAVPRHPGLERGGLLLGRRLTPVTFDFAGIERQATLYDGKLASGVELLVVDVDGLFARPGIHGENGADYPDDAARYALFSRAVAEVVKAKQNTAAPFAIVHAHDWATALVPFFLRKLGVAVKTVLTVHDVTKQGTVARTALASVGLDWADFTVEGVEFWGSANLLKGGLLAADALTTVSETYAKDLLRAEHAAKLEGVIAHRSAVLGGIVNGIDGSVWNPATDVALASRYDVEDLTNKARCKGALLTELGLNIGSPRPLAIFSSHLTEQKGADFLAAALPKLLAADFAIVVAGDGDEAIRTKIATAAKKHEGQLAYLQTPTDGQIHKLYGAADIVLAPSRYEPCGLVQLYAQRYGALPVARAAGGIRDTVIDCDADLETGTGFLFSDATVDDFVGAAQRARAAYDHPRFRALVRRVMRLDLGWERPARRYDQLYKSLEAPKAV